MPTIKRAVVKITNWNLRELLHLPESVRVVGVVERVDDRYADRVSVILEGDGLPDKCSYLEGSDPMCVDLVVHTKPIIERVEIG